VGRRGIVVEKTKAYIAGFLDGDGSIFLQLVRRKDYIFGYQVRASIVFYQKTTQKKILRWLIHKLRVGYLRDRNDGMSEYTIVGLKEVKRVLELVEPYLILKRSQTKLAIRLINRLDGVERSQGFLLRIAKEVDKFAKLNYSKKRVNNAEVLRKFFQQHTSVPVSTDSR
jgi:intein-encoded DNA endonuclease-like protein